MTTALRRDAGAARRVQSSRSLVSIGVRVRCGGCGGKLVNCRTCFDVRCDREKPRSCLRSPRTSREFIVQADSEVEAVVSLPFASFRTDKPDQQAVELAVLVSRSSVKISSRSKSCWTFAFPHLPRTAGTGAKCYARRSRGKRSVEVLWEVIAGRTLGPAPLASVSRQRLLKWNLPRRW